MIQPLRRAHRVTFIGLAVVLPVVFVAGLAVRGPLPPSERVSDRITFTLPTGTEMVADSRDLWGAGVDAPDPLVYWNDRLLGSLSQARREGLRLPATNGSLILYSLGWRKQVGRAQVPKEMP
jgi:hypothetical protein